MGALAIQDILPCVTSCLRLPLIRCFQTQRVLAPERIGKRQTPCSAKQWLGLLVIRWSDSLALAGQAL